MGPVHHARPGGGRTVKKTYGMAGAALTVDGERLEIAFEPAPAAVRQLAAPSAPTWRKEPPTVADVEKNQWWWNKPATGAPPHILQLTIEGCRRDEAGDIVDLGYLDPNADGVTAVIVDDSGDGEFHVFNPDDWPGEWAPCIPPGDSP